jgi:DNA repair exonuclease SbcCD ATPase subunit
MDLIQSIYLSSAAGAGLFFGAGLLVSRAFPPKNGVASADGGTAHADKEARERAEAQVAALQQRSDELTRSLTEERARAEGAQKLQGEAQRLREQVSQLQAELNRARAQASGPSPAEAQLRQENADLRQRASSADQLSQALQAERARAHDLEQRLAHASAARPDDGQRQELERRLAEAQGQVQAAQAQLAQANAQAQQSRAQAQQAEKLAAENAQLKQRTGGADKLGAELATEKAKVAQLQTQVTALQKTAEGTSKLAQDLQAEKAKVRDLETKLATAQKAGGDAGKASAELTAERAKVQQLQTQIASLQQASTEVQRLGKELAAERAKITDLEARLVAAQSAPKSVQGGDMAVADAQRRASDAEAKLRDAKSQLVAAEARAQEVERLRAESTRLAGELDIMKRTQISPRDFEALQKKHTDLGVRARILEQRAAEYDYYVNENSDLRRRLEELEAIAMEAKQLRRRIIDLEAQAFAMTAARSVADKDPRAPISIAPPSFRNSDKRLETLLEESMSSLIREETGGRAVVLADMRGLVIAAAGEARYQSELAAAASVAAEVSERIRNLLPIAEPYILNLVDVNSVVLRTRWLRWEEETLALSVLGFREETPDPGEERVVRAVSKLMGYG